LIKALPGLAALFFAWILSTGIQRWERACSRRRPPCQWLVDWSTAFREQARSHKSKLPA